MYYLLLLFISQNPTFALQTRSGNCRCEAPSQAYVSKMFNVATVLPGNVFLGLDNNLTLNFNSESKPWMLSSLSTTGGG